MNDDEEMMKEVVCEVVWGWEIKTVSSCGHQALRCSAVKPITAVAVRGTGLWHCVPTCLGA
jgi:hypothetical protein